MRPFGWLQIGIITDSNIDTTQRFGIITKKESLISHSRFAFHSQLITILTPDQKKHTKNTEDKIRAPHDLAGL